MKCPSRYPVKIKKKEKHNLKLLLSSCATTLLGQLGCLTKPTVPETARNINFH
jgi:hypothetical protein